MVGGFHADWRRRALVGGPSRTFGSFPVLRLVAAWNRILRRFNGFAERASIAFGEWNIEFLVNWILLPPKLSKIQLKILEQSCCEGYGQLLRNRSPDQAQEPHRAMRASARLLICGFLAAPASGYVTTMTRERGVMNPSPHTRTPSPHAHTRRSFGGAFVASCFAVATASPVLADTPVGDTTALNQELLKSGTTVC